VGTAEVAARCTRPQDTTTWQGTEHLQKRVGHYPAVFLISAEMDRNAKALLEHQGLGDMQT
jgi:hypothetical protein